MTGSNSSAPLCEQVARTLRNAPAGGLEIKGITTAWSEVARIAGRIDDALSAAGLGPGTVVGILGRNDLFCAATFLALLASRRCIAILNPFRPQPLVVADANATDVAATLIEEIDVDSGAWDAAKGHVFILHQNGIVSSHRAGTPTAMLGRQEAAIWVPTSGTTGVPRRIALRADTVSRALQEIAMFHCGFGDLALPPGDMPPLIQYSPLAHIGGALTLARAGAEGRSAVLLQKFDPAEWAEVIRRRKVRTTGLPPAMMRMTLDANVSPANLDSLVSVWSGSAPVDPLVEDAFTDRYGLPVLGNYGATEFCGAVATWSLAEYHQHREQKPPAVGRIWPTVASARVVDPDTHLPLCLGEVGVLEMQVHRVGPNWLRTNDLAAMDEQSFLFLHGRADSAINRGGFKIVPDIVATALRRHPDITEAAVVGIDDARLGQIPVAAVEAPAGAAKLSEADLIAFARTQLPSYQIPSRILVLAALPRTPLMKVDLQAVRGLFAER
jgi:long-chain acyl-CoA synthetase